MYKVEFENRCLMELRRLDIQTARKALEIIEHQIAKDPYDAKQLTGAYKGLYSFRSGNYRIIYGIIEERITILILRVGHRKNVHDGL